MHFIKERMGWDWTDYYRVYRFELVDPQRLSLKAKLLFSHSVVSDSLQPHGLQYTRLPYPLLFPGVCSNSYPLSPWCIQPSHPLSTPSFPALNLFQHQGFFSNVLAFPIRWPEYWSFSFSISPSNEYSGFICLRIDWLDHLVQGLSSLLQTIVWKYQFSGVQPSL